MLIPPPQEVTVFGCCRIFSTNRAFEIHSAPGSGTWTSEQQGLVWHLIRVSLIMWLLTPIDSSIAKYCWTMARLTMWRCFFSFPSFVCLNFYFALSWSQRCCIEKVTYLLMNGNCRPSIYWVWLIYFQYHTLNNWVTDCFALYCGLILSSLFVWKDSVVSVKTWCVVLLKQKSSSVLYVWKRRRDAGVWIRLKRISPLTDLHWLYCFILFLLS